METASNRVDIKGNPKPEIEVKVVNKNNNEEVKRYVDVIESEHKILINLKFQWKTDDYQEVNPDQIEYFIKKNEDCWEVEKDEITIKPGKREEFEKVKKEMHKKLLEDKFGGEFEIKKDIGGTDMKYMIVKDGENYKVKIFEGDGNNDRQFSWEKVEVEPQFWLNKEVGFDNVFGINYQEEEKKSP